MRGRSQLARTLADGWRLALTLGVAGALTGCGPGFSLRGRGTTDIGTRAPGATERAAAATEPSAAASPATDGDDARDDHEDDELPALPATDTTSPEERESDALEPAHVEGARAPAMRYASLDRAACEAELDARHIAYEPIGETRGVVAPLRLKGPIAGVSFHSMLPLAQRTTSPYEIYDCRLVLALDDWARVLARHDVVEVVHYSVYRPPPKKRALHGPGRRHSGALAIDAAIFKLRDGRTLSVEKDFHGRIGGKPCPRIRAKGMREEAIALRELVCEAADAQLFNVMLTPDYNRPHHNHFHMEVTAGARWTFVR